MIDLRALDAHGTYRILGTVGENPLHDERTSSAWLTSRDVTALCRPPIFGQRR
jgi:hypothetical protein